MTVEKEEEDKAELEKALTQSEITDIQIEDAMVSMSVVRQKNDEIDRLQSLLDKEKVSHQETMKELGDLREETRITEERIEHALREKEQYDEMKVLLQQESLQVQEAVKDKDVQIEGLQAKI
mmetsp:Transcript_5616/g.8864  ORF Transcript_5616/g.8864 Transcript_5616/m.8864 type:complete len:122 (+) Transcript_5616:616-981(+)